MTSGRQRPPWLHTFALAWPLIVFRGAELAERRGLDLVDLVSPPRLWIVAPMAVLELLLARSIHCRVAASCLADRRRGLP